MRTKGPKPGSPIPWEATAEGFFIYSVDPVEYIKVVFPWGGTRKFVVAKDENVPAPDFLEMTDEEIKKLYGGE